MGIESSQRRRTRRSAKDQEAVAGFARLLCQLPDPRRRQGIRYPLPSVVLIALLAMISGCDDAYAMELWGRHHEKWLSTFLDLPHGAPSQDVFLSVFAALSPPAFSELFVAWTTYLRGRLQAKGKHIAIDGKTSRRSHDRSRDKPAVHTVSAWLSEEGLVLGQWKTGTKSNEIIAIPELLGRIDLRGATVTIDAMGCQTDIASAIVERGGNYLLAVKDNQPTLHRDVVATFADAFDNRPRPLDQPVPTPVETHFEVDKAHGRLEERRVHVARALDWMTTSERWRGLGFVAMAESTRTDLTTGNTTIDRRYFIGSDRQATAEHVATLVRRHWSIENELHWVLDLAFNEDQARHRAGYCADNMATLRHMALNLVRHSPGRRAGVRTTRMLAGWDRAALLRIVTG